MPSPRLPRVYVVRHGETEWSISGQHTGVTDLPLTENGEKVVKELGKQIVGDGKLLCPKTISRIFVSPRKRAQRTFELLFSSLPPEDRHPNSPNGLHVEPEITDLVREWDYGEYEGKTSAEINDERKKMGLPKWDIWTEGCPGGESAEQMKERMDKLVKIVNDLHVEYWKKVQEVHDHGHEDGVPPIAGPGTNPEKEGFETGGDVLIVAHGHFTKCFLARWSDLELEKGRIFVVDAGGVNVGGYQHKNVQERSLLGVNLYSL